MARRDAAPMLELRDAAIRLGGRRVFRDTTWRLNPGEHWAIVGPSGSGKSILAAALAGRLPVVEGERGGTCDETRIALVSFDDQHAYSGDGPAGTRWFSLEQDEAPRLRDRLTIEQIEGINPFEVGARPSRGPAAFARERGALLRRLGIAHLLDRPLIALSNGERMKALLAAALLRRPAVLIFDDPFAGLDATSREDFRHLIAAEIARGRVGVIVTTTRENELPAGITHRMKVAGLRIVTQGPLTRPPATSRRPTATGPVLVDRDPTAPEAVAFRAVTIRYGRTVVLDRLNWTVRRGEAWVVAGPNGSGKTTLLSLIDGSHPQANANDIRIFGLTRGRDANAWDIRARIGIVSPDVHLHVDASDSVLTVVWTGWQAATGEDVAPPARVQRRARSLLKRFGLAAVAGEPFAALSTGRQRLALLARALVHEPEMLLLDEPGQGLDETQRQNLIRHVEDLIRGGLTLLYVSHHRDEWPRRLHGILRLPGRRAVSRRR